MNIMQKKLINLAIASGITIINLGSCSANKQSMLEKTSIDNVVVCEVDGQLGFIIKKSSMYLDKRIRIIHYHYIDQISGIIIVDKKSDCDDFNI